MRAFLFGGLVVLLAHLVIGRLGLVQSPDEGPSGQSAPPAAVRAQAQSTWVDLAPLQEPRQEVAVAALDGRIYVAGGFRDGGGTVGTVEVYDPATNSWQFAAPLPIAVNHAVAATVGNTLYVFGGHPASGAEAVDNVFAYDAATNTWSARAPMPTARGALAVAAVDGKVYAAGGSPGPREFDFAMYDPALDTWTTLPNMPTPRNHLAAAGANGKVYVAGGRSGDIGGITSILEEYDPATNAWTQRTAMPTARGGIGAAAANGLVFVFGGEGNRRHPQGIFDQVEAYDPSTDSWQIYPPMAVPRHGISAATLGNRIYVPGGATVEGFGVIATNQALQLE